jgi:gluconolactonase
MKRRTAAVVLALAAGAAIPAALVGSAGADTVEPCADGTAPLPATTVAATEVRGGFAFTEGPTWVAEPGFLLFSDMQNGTGAQGVQPSDVWKFTPPDTFEKFIPAAGSNGLAVTDDGGAILAATHDERTLSSYSLADRSRSRIAADFDGRAFNSPNDIAVSDDGTIYFTDPNFQRANRADEMAGVTGVFRVTDGRVELVDGTVSQPNGIVLSPDGTTLYVGAGGTHQIFSYPVLEDGSTGPRTVLTRLNGPDGGTVDCAGNLYWASFSDGRVHVIAPDGRELGTITAGRNTTNAAFGGEDGRTLFITSGVTGAFSIYSVRLNLPGNAY